MLRLVDTPKDDVLMTEPAGTSPRRRLRKTLFPQAIMKLRRSRWSLHGCLNRLTRKSTPTAYWKNWNPPPYDQPTKLLGR
jgi:hypothetical protein